MSKNRPTGITLLAILEFIGAIFCFVGGALITTILVLVLGVELGGILSTVLGGAMFIVGIIAAILGWGLWTGKNWARILLLIGAGLGLLGGISGLFIEPMSALTSLAYNGIIVWYMFRPNVKQFFKAK